MERFINTAHINYCKRLSDPDIDKDPVRRIMLTRLLTDELAKDATSKLTVQEVAHLEADLLAQRLAMSSVEYWAAMHRAEP
jgi:hypothetical protein